MALARLVAAVIDKLTLTNWAPPKLRIWGSGVRISSGAPLNQGFQRNAVLIARQSHGP
jgi:hypothetical protein